MQRRSCGSLLAVWLLTLCSPAALWAQSTAISAKAGVNPLVDPLAVDRPAPVHLQPPAWAGSTPFHPKAPRQFAGTGSGRSLPPGRAPTFPQLARTAGTIFAGTVTKIDAGPAAGGSAVPTVAITFHVERPLRGTVPGGSLTILEWLGLWSSGQRYAVGEHVLLFLYPPSKLGLTSVVGGSLGQFRVDAAGGILLSDQQLAVFQAEPLLAGRSRVALNDFSRALRHATGGQDPE
ncbi:MAG: hypothetical protein WBQ08_00035 [Candidatus Sulfotelmatobacter sp.]